MSAADPAPIRIFFDAFVAAFGSFEGARVAALFATPGVALRRDGSIVALGTPGDVEGYYQAALDRYRGEGCRSCRWDDLDVVPMGGRAVLATVSWSLLRADRSLLLGWRQSYGLSLTVEGPRIFFSAMHP